MVLLPLVAAGSCRDHSLSMVEARTYIVSPEEGLGQGDGLVALV